MKSPSRWILDGEATLPSETVIKAQRVGDMAPWITEEVKVVDSIAELGKFRAAANGLVSAAQRLEVPHARSSTLTHIPPR